MSVSISREREGVLYAGTTFTLACMIALSPEVTIPVTVSAQWTHNEVNISANNNISTDLTPINSLSYNATLTFSPLSVTYSGDYKCNVHVSPASFNTYIRNAFASAGDSIIIHGKHLLYLYS